MLAETASRHNEVMTSGRTKMSSTGHIRDLNVVVRQVPGSHVMKAVMHHYELELHSFTSLAHQANEDGHAKAASDRHRYV